MSYTTIGRNKVYASIEDLPENLKLSNGDRLIIQTDNGTALVDWENVKIDEEHTSFATNMDDINAALAEQTSFNTLVNSTIENHDTGIKTIATDLQLDYTSLVSSELSEGDNEEIPETEPQSPRLKNILARLDCIEKIKSEETEENTLKAPRIDKIEETLETKINEETFDTKIEEINNEIEEIKKLNGLMFNSTVGTVNQSQTLNDVINEFKTAIEELKSKVAELETTIKSNHPTTT